MLYSLKTLSYKKLPVFRLHAGFQAKSPVIPCFSIVSRNGGPMSDIYKSNIEIDYVDGIMLTDEKGNIVYSVRFNPRFCNESTEKDFTQILGKNFLEVYTSMQEEESSIVKCIKSGKVILNYS